MLPRFLVASEVYFATLFLFMLVFKCSLSCGYPLLLFLFVIQLFFWAVSCFAPIGWLGRWLVVLILIFFFLPSQPRALAGRRLCCYKDHWCILEGYVATTLCWIVLWSGVIDLIHVFFPGFSLLAEFNLATVADFFNGFQVVYFKFL